MRVPADSFLRTTPVAHRGFHGGGVPENSYAAFEKAIALHYAIETDVRETADGQLVLFHDDTLARMTGDAREVREVTQEEIAALRLGGTEERIPLFSEFLERVAGRVPLLIELKGEPDRAAFVANVLAALKNYRGEFALQTFDPRILRQIKKQAPHVLRGQLACRDSGERSAFRRWVVRAMPLNFLNKPDFISYCAADLPCRRAKRGKPLLCWTVRDADEYLRVKPLVDNVIFENIRPEQLYVTCGLHK